MAPIPDTVSLITGNKLKNAFISDFFFFEGIILRKRHVFAHRWYLRKSCISSCSTITCFQLPDSKPLENIFFS